MLRQRFRLKGGVLGFGLVWAAIAALDRGLLGGMLFIDLAADALFGFAWRPLAFAMAQNVMVLAFGVWLAGRLLTVRSDVLAFFVEGEPSLAETAPQSGHRQDDQLHRRLSALVETQRTFLDPELTFAAFVERMGAPERAVRTLVNHELGYDHFRTFLNNHRVTEARRLLRDPERSNDKLITVALDSGFASLASFNRAFLAIEGRTPSQYRDAVRLGGPTVHTWRKPGFEERKTMF